MGGSVMRKWTICNWIKVQLCGDDSEDVNCWHPVGTLIVIDEKPE